METAPRRISPFKLIIFVIISFICLPHPAYANVVWPALGALSGFSSALVIIPSLFIECLTVIKITGLSRRKSTVITLVFSLISVIIGIIGFGLSEIGVVNGYDLIFLAQAGWVGLGLTVIAAIPIAAVNLLFKWITLQYLFKISIPKNGVRILFLISLATVLLSFIYGRMNPLTI